MAHAIDPLSTAGSQAHACVISNIMTELAGFGPQFTNTERTGVQEIH